jgi:hypothetical protein
MEEEKQLPAWSKGQTDRKVKMYDAHHQDRVERYRQQSTNSVRREPNSR